MANHESLLARAGFAADPALEILLPKDLLARIKILKIDQEIRDLNQTRSLLKTQREMLAREYNIDVKAAAED